MLKENIGKRLVLCFCFAVFISALIACNGKQDKPKIIVGDKEYSSSYLDEYLRQNGAEKSSDEIKRKLIEGFINKEILKQSYMDKHGKLSVSDKVKIDNLERDIVAKKYLDKNLENPKEKQLKAIYKDNLEEFKETSAVVGMIMLKNGSEEDRMIKMRTVYSRLVNGEEFDDLVEEYSEDEYTKARKGSLGNISKKKLDVKLSEKIFQLKKGEFTKPFAYLSAVYIFKLIDGPSNNTRPYDKVRDLLLTKWKNQNEKKIINEHKQTISVSNTYSK